MCHMCFWKYDVPTCGTRPGWRCRRRWAWLRGLWHTWDHSQSISLEKLDIKHVPYMFLMILTNSLSCFHWSSSSTSMGVSMTSNRVHKSILQTSILCSLRKFLPQIRWRSPPPLSIWPIRTTLILFVMFSFYLKQSKIFERQCRLKE